MFDKFFKQVFKSRKLYSEEEAQEMKVQIEKLQEDNKIRETQVAKLNGLVQQDPVNSERYNKRIDVHNRIIKDNEETIQDLEIKLLDS